LPKVILTGKWVDEFISNRMLYLKLRGCWCDIIVLQVCAPTEDKSGDTKDSFNDEIEHGFDKPLKF
jgi:hypothetical protein